VKRLAGLLLTMVAFCAVPRAASADVFGFGCYHMVNATNCATLESQISVDITQSGDWLNFKFVNSGPSASFIDGLYFSDPPPSLLGGSPSFIYSNPSTVQFSATCMPGDLPNNWGTTYCSDADAPASKNGVNPGEWVQISYKLVSPASLTTVVNGLWANTFDIGIKVQGFANGGSEWATVGNTVPEPATLALFAVGAGIAGLRRRRLARKAS